MYNKKIKFTLLYSVSKLKGPSLKTQTQMDKNNDKITEILIDKLIKKMGIKRKDLDMKKINSIVLKHLQDRSLK